MKTLLLLLALSGPVGFQQALLTLTGASCVEELSEDEVQRYQSLAAHPVDLNHAGRGRLLATGLLTPYQVASLLDYRERTGGLFDVTVYPVVELWGFISKEYRVPSDGELLKALDLVGMDTIEAFDPESGRIAGILHTFNDSVADTIHNDRTEILRGQDFFYEKLLGLSFKITPFSFFQTNSRGAEVLYSLVRDYIGSTK